MNCFQICIFVSDDTAVGYNVASNNSLWIAFKFVSLYRMTQLNEQTSPRAMCCELLSNLYLCIGWHSYDWVTYTGRYGCELLSNLYLCIGWHSSLLLWYKYITVVNCFQICIFVSDDTARCHGTHRARQLWIAFKFVSLYRMTQLAAKTIDVKDCCELLSNLYLCIGWHSTQKLNDNQKSVVNCFQICIFVSDDTAKDWHERNPC